MSRIKVDAVVTVEKMGNSTIVNWPDNAPVDWAWAGDKAAAAASEVTRSPHFDEWSDARPWQKGDRWPSAMEQIMNARWFKNLPATDDDPNAWYNKEQTGAGSQYNLGRVTLAHGDEVSLPFPSKEDGSGEQEITCVPGARLMLSGVIPDIKGRGGHLSLRAPDGKDNLSIAATFTRGPSDPGAAASVAFLPYNIEQPENGFADLKAGETWCLNIRADSGTFVLQNQLPR